MDTKSLLAVIKPTSLGKPKADLSIQLVKGSTRLYEAKEDGSARVPRTRKSSNVWPEWFEALDAPKTRYFFVDAAEMARNEDYEPVEVFYDAESELFNHVSETGEVIAQYTGDNVREMKETAVQTFKGSPDAINNLQNAITRFNTKTGKKLVIRFVSDERDKSGRTLQGEREVIRVL